MWMKGEGKSSRRLTQVDAAGGETSVCVVTGLLYPQGESGAAATEKTRVLRVGCRAGIKIARGGRFVPSSPCYRLKLTGPLRPVHISIPALRAEGDFFEPAGQSIQQISIHTLRMEGDTVSGRRCTGATNFYPRPHMEGDKSLRLLWMSAVVFLPTPSHGGRRRFSAISDCAKEFLPTPSAWRATSEDIDIPRSAGFLSTPSAWRATSEDIDIPRSAGFLSTPSA